MIGVVSFIVLGGIEFYIYDWDYDSNLDSLIVSDLVVGSYILIVIDVNGCSVEGVVMVFNLEVFNFFIEIVVNLSCLDNDGFISV